MPSKPTRIRRPSRALGLTTLLAICCPAGALARDRDGPRSDEPPRIAEWAIEALTSLSYLLGDWRVVSMYRQEDGSFAAAEDVSFFRARQTYDGSALVEEFYGPDRDAFFSLRVLTWDAATDEIVASFFNPRRNRRIEFRGSAADGLLMANVGGYGQRNQRLYRERDVLVDPDTVERRVEHSDDGVVWHAGDYYCILRRETPAGSKPKPPTVDRRDG